MKRRKRLSHALARRLTRPTKHLPLYSSTPHGLHLHLWTLILDSRVGGLSCAVPWWAGERALQYPNRCQKPRYQSIVERTPSKPVQNENHPGKNFAHKDSCVTKRVCYREDGCAGEQELRGGGLARIHPDESNTPRSNSNTGEEM